MPLDRLEKHILEDAESRASEIEGKGREAAAKTLDDARSKAKNIREAAEISTNAEISKMDAEQNESIELQERSALLEARNKAMQHAMVKLKALVIKRMKKAGYSRLIANAVHEARSIAPEGELTLMIGRKEAKQVRDFGGRIKYGNAGNGVELSNRSGSIRISATIDGLFEENRQEIETMLLEEAFKAHVPAVRRTGRKRGR